LIDDGATNEELRERLNFIIATDETLKGLKDKYKLNYQY